MKPIPENYLWFELNCFSDEFNLLSPFILLNDWDPQSKVGHFAAKIFEFPAKISLKIHWTLLAWKTRENISSSWLKDLDA